MVSEPQWKRDRAKILWKKRVKMVLPNHGRDPYIEMEEEN